FNEDALIIIRCLRIQAQLGCTIDKITFHGMKSHISDIKYLSIERIVIELKKLTSRRYIDRSFQNLPYFKAFNYIPFFKHYDLSQMILDESVPFSLFI